MLPASGVISMNSINTELSASGYSPTQTISLNDTKIRWLGNVASGAISLSNFYGKANRIAVTVTTISANVNNYVLDTTKIPGYLAGLMDITLTINSGVVVGSGSTGSAGFTVSGFTSGDVINITNNGYIVGAGGNGGSANSGSGASGGVALAVSFPTKVTNNGTIGGGGGGGGAGYQSSYTSSGGTPQTYYYTGCGGGGGAGYIVGSGGTGTAAGAAGSLTAGGAGGVAGGNYISGGNGGALGSAGTAIGGAGGAGGACTSGNSNITWLVTGTRAGSLN